MSGWRVVPLQGALGPHAAEWDALNARAFGCHPLLTSSFVDGLLRNFGSGSEYLCRYEDKQGVRAMCVLRRKNAMLWASFVPAQAQVGPTMIGERALLESLLRSLPGCVAQLDLLCNDPDLGQVLAQQPGGPAQLNHALTMNIALEGDFEAYWNARPRHMQSNMKRYLKRLDSDALACRFERVADPAGVAAALERYVALEGAGWKGKLGTALGAKPEQYRFYRDLLLQAAERGDAIVYELWLGTTLAASRLVLRQGRMLVMLKTGYDESLAVYSPGRLLLRAVIESAFATDPGGVLEFYTDADTNLLEWSSGRRWIQHVTLYRWRALGALLTAGRLFKKRANGEGGQTVEVANHPSGLAADVQAFLAKAEKRNFELGAAWYTNLVDTVYADHANVRFYVLRKESQKESQIQAVLPLRAEKGALGWRLYSLSNFYTSLYEPVFESGLKSADLLPLLAALERDFPRLASLKLTPMDPASHAWQTLLGALRASGWLPFEYFSFGNWSEPVAHNWAGYLDAREQTLKSTLRRMGKKFAAESGTLEIVTQPKQIAAAIAAYEQVYAASWKKPEPYPAFTPGLAQTYAARGSLRLGLAWLGGKPVAAQLWIVSHGRAAIYKLAYDEQYKAYSPGTLLTALLMEHAIDKDKVSEVDYLIGDDPYKKSWMSQRRERWGVIAFNPRTPGGLAGMAREWAGRALKGARRRLR